MSYCISTYRKEADFPESSLDVSELGGAFLSDLFGIPLREFVNVYPLDEQHAEAISGRLEITFDLASCDYFLEVVAD
ncbi:hypothetical protein [Kitasatospora sp. NPDC098663]|uniref:DUF7683 domain-containing protein n=1 Tax=Kitasatospora sp. NPDC098663 TaxID=3364096 RepID=UPI0038143688